MSRDSIITGKRVICPRCQHSWRYRRCCLAIYLYRCGAITKWEPPGVVPPDAFRGVECPECEAIWEVVPTFRLDPPRHKCHKCGGSKKVPASRSKPWRKMPCHECLEESA